MLLDLPIRTIEILLQIRQPEKLWLKRKNIAHNMQGAKSQTNTSYNYSEYKS